MTYVEYKAELLQRLREDSAINGSDTEDEFIEHTLSLLTEFDEIDSPVRLKMGDKKGKGNRLMRIDGYSFDETDKSLILLISDFQDRAVTENLTETRVDELYWRLYYFLDEACNGAMAEYFDDSSDELQVARFIKSRVNPVKVELDDILKIKFFILTNKELSVGLINSNLLETTIKTKKGKVTKTKTTKRIKKSDFNNKPIEINLWHLERFYEMENSNSNDPVVIDIKNDFPELGYEGIPCLKGNIGEDLGYDAYIAIIPAKLLASIYIEHGSKVLEGNVRAFLGTSGAKSVNSGIKRTINTDPTKFFTYNNGIATTAAEVEIEENNGEMLISKMVDLQIINGGQTTASLAEAVLKKTNPGLEGIFVPMKLTVIEDRETEDEDGVRFYDKMVQDIAKYANSQNRITAADLFSNDPFHIWMERMSKKYLAPPAEYAIPTGWYYERSRKKYLQEQIKMKGDEAKRFALKFPKKQIINKEQLAMYITAIKCKPHIVSKGKNWAMKEFGAEIGNEYRTNKAVFNEFYFKKCVCAAIIFRTVDNYLETNKDSAKRPTGFWYKAGGYKGNIVPYTIAKILSSIPGGYTLDWDKIWQKQSLSKAFMHEIEIVTKMTNDFICDSHGVIVTEYCKRETTWNEYKALGGYKPSKEFIDELVSAKDVSEAESKAKKDQKETNDLQVLMDMYKLGAEHWEKVLKVGKDMNKLSYSEITNISQIIKMVKSATIPSSKTGKLPATTMKVVKSVLEAKEKLEVEGLLK